MPLVFKIQDPLYTIMSVLEFEMKLSSVSKRIREVAKAARFQSEQIGILLT